MLLTLFVPSVLWLHLSGTVLLVPLSHVFCSLFPGPSGLPPVPLYLCMLYALLLHPTDVIVRLVDFHTV